MSADTCAVLAGVFPLILITNVLESRSVHKRIRRRPFFRKSRVWGVSTSLTGLVFAVVGVNLGGYSGSASLPLWLLFGAAMVCMAMTVLGLLATSENEDDRQSNRN